MSRYLACHPRPDVCFWAVAKTMPWSMTDGALGACADICGSSYHCGHRGLLEFGPVHVPPQGPSQSKILVPPPKTTVTSGSNCCQVIMLWLVSELMSMIPVGSEDHAEACSLG